MPRESGPTDVHLPGSTPGSTLAYQWQLFLYVRTIFPRAGWPTSYAAIT
jgi:hypothetical protein